MLGSGQQESSEVISDGGYVLTSFSRERQWPEKNHFAIVSRVCYPRRLRVCQSLPEFSLGAKRGIH